MQTVTTVGLDIAKSVFQVHGVDAKGNVILRRQIKRRYVLAFFQKLRPCLVGVEACASSHYWSRELQALGHTVRLMPPAYVKPYVKRHKNDAADAEAICEAVTRANMRFVATKTPEQQSCLRRRTPTPHHVFRDRRLRDFEPEHQQLIVNPGSTPSGFSVLIRRIRSRRSRPILGRPALFLDFHRQNTLKPVRCHRRIVSGLTNRAMPTWFGQSLVINTSNARSLPLNRIRDGARRNAMLS